MTTYDDDHLLRLAREAMSRAHSPYSRVRVGAAVLDSRGDVFLGCNVENASLGLTVCAERIAVWSARAQGAGEIVRVVLTSDHPKVQSPCGACRQVLLELAPRARIVFGDGSGVLFSWDSPGALLPSAFDASWAD